MKPLRIGLFTDTFLPDQNGITTSLCLLADELCLRGHAVEIVAPQMTGSPETRRDVRRVRSVAYPLLPTYRLAWPGRYDVGERYDLIHTHTPLTLGMAAARLAQRSQVPLVATYHTHIEAYTHYLPGMSALQRRTQAITRLMARHYRRAQAVITPTFEMLGVLRQMQVAWPVVIPTSIDPVQLQAAPGIADPWPPGYRRLLSIGRLAREKRFDVLLRALARLPDAALLILGEGPERHALEQLACSLGIAHRVHFAGVRPWQEMGSYYRWAELFLFASDSETQGLVLQEAQLMRVPVVAVGAGGTLRAVAAGRSGELVAPGDVDGLVRHSRALLDNEQKRASYAAEAGRFACEWTPGLVAERTLDVYAAVLAGRQPAFTAAGAARLESLPTPGLPAFENTLVYDH